MSDTLTVRSEAATAAGASMPVPAVLEAVPDPVPAPYRNVAVLMPCFNEALTVGQVVADFAAALPGAGIFVFDNNSTDRTGAVARSSGATVVQAPRQGKGNVVRQMFAQVDAELYLMVDGDGTYPASAAPALIAELRDSKADMVVGVRMATFDRGAFRRFHEFGNRLVARLISRLFGASVTDVLSGYRVFSRAFVKAVPLTSERFEVETEMTLQALAKRFLLREVPVPYGTRPEGSHSKLNTFSDGFLVLKCISMIFKDYKPLVFFSALSALLFAITLAAGAAPILDYVRIRYVLHVPLAILATGAGLLSALSLSVGLILHTISRYHDETFELFRKLLDTQGPPRA
jgi:glycosyltransferase involved in cell wall biosynthesis